MLLASNFTGQVLNMEILDRIMESSEETGIKEVDFSDVTILPLVHERIAWYIVFYGLVPRGLTDSRDIEQVSFHKRAYMQPTTDNLNEFKRIFRGRFSEGEPCILDSTNYGKITSREGNRVIIMIKGSDEKYVYIRRYHSSKVQPKFFKEAGGYNSRELYINTQVSFVDLFNMETLIDHPKDSLERGVLDELFGTKPTN